MMKKVFVQVTNDDLKDTAAILRAASEGRLFVEEQEASVEPLPMVAASDGKVPVTRTVAARSTGSHTVRLTPTRATFRMDCAPEAVGILAQRLHLGLLALGMIDDRTPVTDVMGLLSGESDCRLRWTGGAECLAYFVNRLLTHPSVSLPHGARKWMVVRSHFIDADGKDFGDVLRHQHQPHKNQRALDMLIELLDPTITREEMIRRMNG